MLHLNHQGKCIMDRDIEKEAAPFIKGYPSLANFIASDHDHSTFIFKRFDRLSALNLLYLQSELAELEALQKAYDREDLLAASSFDERLSKRDWKTFHSRASNTTDFPRDEKRMKLARDIRSKLKEYKETLLLDSQFLSLQRPSKQVYTAFYNHFWNADNPKGCYPTLLGDNSSVYDDRDDLVALVRPPEEDRLSAFLRKHCSLLFLTRRDTHTGSLAYISAQRIALVVGIINIILAVMFLFGGILSLYYIDNAPIRLSLIGVYTVAFALCISLFTNARRSEVFGASAAYAAVLVVFVSGN